MEIREPHFLNELLRQPSEPFVFGGEDDLGEILGAMQIACDFYEGMSISACEIGINKSIFMIRMDSEGHTMYVPFINPVIVELCGATRELMERCISYPQNVKVKRFNRVTLRWFDVEGNEQEQSYVGATSSIIQHEMDHINGELFYSEKSRYSRQRIEKSMKETSS